MRDDDKASPDEETAEPQARRSGLLITIAVLLVSLAAGGAVGVAVIGPRLPTAAAAQPGHEDEGGGKGGKGHGKAESNQHAIESLVVNPAGTHGTRFLIVTIVVDLEDGKSAEALKARDAAVRDVLLGVLGSKTIEQLSDVEEREALKGELVAAMTSAAPSTRIRRVYLPQFVLQ